MPELLVTGATGCVGRATVQRALRSGWRVRGLARREPPAWWPAGAAYIRGSVEDPRSLGRAAAGCDAVVHLGAPVHQRPRSDEEERAIWRVTVDGTTNAARAAHAAGGRFLLVSTIGVYGAPPPRRSDEHTSTHPTTAYGRAKLAAEQRAQVEHGRAIVLRCAVVYGPGDRGNVRRLIEAIDRGRGFVLGRGVNRKSLLFSVGLADRILLALETDAQGTWCVADRPAPTQRELADLIARSLGRPRPRAVPLGLALGGARALDTLRALRGAGEGRWSATIRSLAAETEVDGSALDARLGYRQQVTLEEGISRTVEWIRAGSEAAAGTEDRADRAYRDP